MTTPLSIPAGIESLREHGYTGGLTRMVIEQALSMHARGEEAKAERKATDASFNGIDITTWKVVLQSAIDAAQKAQPEADAPLQQFEALVEDSPFGDGRVEVDPSLAERTHDLDLVKTTEPTSEDELPLSALYQRAHASQVSDPASKLDTEAIATASAPSDVDPIEALQDVWHDVPAVSVQPPAAPPDGARDITVVREITAGDVLRLLAEHHSSDKRHDCGAQTQPLPCKYTNGRTAHVYHCTEEPGHAGLHKDALHCWSFESFSDDMVVQHAPRDRAGCTGCQSLGMSHRWPCPYSKEIAEVARHFGVDLAQQS